MSKLIGAPKKEQRRENCFSQKFNKKCNSYVQILKGPWPSTRPSDGNRNAHARFCPYVHWKKYILPTMPVPKDLPKGQIPVCLCPQNSPKYRAVANFQNGQVPICIYMSMPNTK